MLTKLLATLLYALTLTHSGPDCILTGDHTYCVGGFASLALDSNGFLFVSYSDETNGNLKLMHCYTADRANPTLTDVDSSSSDVGWSSSLALDSNGFLVVSYSGETNGNLKLMRCYTTDCANATLTDVDSSSSDVGWSSSLALDSNGFPVISYHDFTNGNIKLARCHTTDCTNATLKIFDNTIYFAILATSLDLDSNDFPVISYTVYDPLTQFEYLRLARCHTTDCANPTLTLTTVDSVLRSWEIYSSLALDSNDYSVISYFDSTNEDLKLARSYNAFCSKSPTPSPNTTPKLVASIPA